MNPADLIIALDDGHGMETAGKRTPIFPAGSKYAGAFMHENEFNKAVVARLGVHLMRCGFKVLYTAPTDVDTPLKERTDLANNTIKNGFNRPVSAFVSVHANAIGGTWNTGGNGIETFVYTGQLNKESGNLAKAVHKRLMEGTTFADRKVKEADLHVVRATSMIAILVECGFMDNLREAELLMTGAYREECAVEIAKGLCDYYCVSYVAENVPQTAPSVPVTPSISTIPVVIKERIYASGGVLKYTDTYAVSATDVRFMKFDKNSIHHAQFVYAKGQTVSQIAKQYGADVAFNFPYFWDGQVLGDAEDDDKVISSAYGKMLKWHEFAFQNGIPVIGQLDLTENQDFVVQGSPPLIENGKLVYEQYRVSDEVADDIGLSRAQRTFVGIDCDGNLLLGIADGRTRSDRGLNLEEMALYMQAKGAVDALNGDGGGSTELYIKGKGIVNQNSGVSERIVHHAILIFMKEAAKPMPVPPVVCVDGTKDVPVDAWYAAVVKEAMTDGLMSVGDDGKFNPDQPITRAMMAQILSNMKRKAVK